MVEAIRRDRNPESSDAVSASAHATCALLDSLPTSAQMTRGGVWTVRDTAVHLIAGTHLYARLVSGAPSPVGEPSSLAILNAGAFCALAEDRPRELATLLANAVNAYHGAASPLPPHETRPWHYGRELPVAFHSALLANELLLHGTDVALAAGVPWQGHEPAARTVWSVLAPWLTPRRFLPDVAGDTQASVALSASGCRTLVFRIGSGTIAASDDPAAPDCVIQGPAMQMLRWYFQRDGWEAAGLEASGQQANLAPRVAEFLRPI